ncbi:MAG: hypothetical protein F4Z57_10220 [Gemmatimonadetes bacterium]|nr:hypothetical protein [Gemmatimonadota bacterium]MYC71073.1 hypothetical protein [Gemmatimonadota bacterium]
MAERSPLDYGDRLGRLEGIIEQINDRLGSLERRMSSLEAQMSSLRSDLESRMSSLRSDLEGRMSSLESKLESRMNSLESSHRRDFRWLIGTMIGMWATMMGLLVTVTVKVFSG